MSQDNNSKLNLDKGQNIARQPLKSTGYLAAAALGLYDIKECDGTLLSEREESGLSEFSN